MKGSELCLLIGTIYLAPHVTPILGAATGMLFCIGAIVIRGMGK